MAKITSILEKGDRVDLGKAFIVPKTKYNMTLADNIFLINLSNISKLFIQTYINSRIGQMYIKRLS